MRKLAQYSVLLAVIVVAAGAYGLKISQSIADHALLLCLLFAYASVTSWAALAVAQFLRAKVRRLRGTLAMVVTFALLVMLSWAVVGTYFLGVATHGLESQQALMTDIFIRRVLSLQQIAVPVVSLIFSGRRGVLDAVLSALGLLVIASLAFSGSHMSY